MLCGLRNILWFVNKTAALLNASLSAIVAFHISIRINVPHFINFIISEISVNIEGAFLQSLLGKARLKFVSTTSLRYDV